MVRFTGRLWRHDGPAAWTFVTVPEELAPPPTHHWGRTPVVASVDGTAWNTSVWRDRQGCTALAVPARIRGARQPGDSVSVTLQLRDD